MAKAKKQIILEYYRARDLKLIAAQEIQAIEVELRRHLGSTGRISRSYIANVLRQAGAQVDYEDRYSDPSMQEPYASRLKGLLRFSDFVSTEASIQKLDAIYKEYRALADRVGTGLVRSLVLKGKERAGSLAANRRVRPEKRQEKQEIARWFGVWLETPELFFDWLELRKSSPEFHRLFSCPDGADQ
jgi:hypothetical protein